MTQQMMDSFEYHGKEFYIRETFGTVPFHPSTWGLKIGFRTPTNCYGGWVPTYGLIDDKLCLMSMSAIRETYQQPEEPFDEKYNQPEINGARMTLSSPLLGFNCHYAGVDLEIPFTGGMLLIADYIPGRRFLTFFWDYEHVHELLFEDGILVSASDKSDLAAKIRDDNLDARIRDKPPEGDAVKAWIASFFQRDYHLFNIR